MRASNWICPKCESQHINNISFDFYNFCIDCGYEWEAT